MDKYTKVVPTEAFFAVHPKTKVKWGVVVGPSRSANAYRVKWDGQINAVTLSTRYFKVAPQDEEKS